MSINTLERVEYRKKIFKRGVDSEYARRKREDESNSIRKNKRVEKLQKKRKNISSGYPTEPNEDIIDLEIINRIYSDNPDVALEGIKYVRKILSSMTDPKVVHLYTLGIVPKLVNYLQYVQYPQHQFESAWALTNIVSGDSDITKDIVEKTEIGSSMMELMKQNNNRDLQTQAIWCLSNIAGENSKYRDIILKQKGLEIIVNILDREISYEKRNISAIRTQIWALSNLIRGNPYPPFSLLMKSIPTIIKLCKDCSDEEVMEDASWTISYITQAASDEQLRILVNMNIVGRDIIGWLGNNWKVSLPILRSCGNLIAGPNDTAQAVLDLDFLNYLPRFFTGNSNVVREACWILSNITVGTKSQLQMVIDNNLIPIVVVLMTNGKWEVKKECCYVLANLVSGGNHDQIEYLVNNGGIKPLCNMLDINSPVNITKMILDTIYRILMNGHKVMKYQQYHDTVEDLGLDKIENLQFHENENIYKKAVKILDQHF